MFEIALFIAFAGVVCLTFEWVVRRRPVGILFTAYAAVIILIFAPNLTPWRTNTLDPFIEWLTLVTMIGLWLFIRFKIRNTPLPTKPRKRGLDSFRGKPIPSPGDSPGKSGVASPAAQPQGVRTPVPHRASVIVELRRRSWVRPAARRGEVFDMFERAR